MNAQKSVRKFTAGGFAAEEFSELESTNSYLKACAKSLPDRSAVTALSQTGGRGRLGRSFYSPGGGLYLSALVKGLPVTVAPLVTPAAAVAVAEAIKSLGAKDVGIKWVNDVYSRGKKVCGILTETCAKDGVLEYAVIGIGVNLSEPEGGFPPEIRERAGAAFDFSEEGLRERLAEKILENLSVQIKSLPDRKFLQAYREMSVVLGREIVICDGGREIPAKALEIDDDCRLIAETSAGRVAVFTGEVTIRPAGNTAKGGGEM